SAARVVRIATHPDATKMGYGSRALQLLSEYFEGNLVTLSGDAEDEGIVIEQGLHRKRAAAGAGASSSSSSNALTKEVLAPTREPPPLMVNVTDLRRPERLHWLGVSYGLTLQLFNFWKRAGYAPMYLRQTPNDLTAEHTAIMLKPLNTSDMPAAEAPRAGWHLGFVADFTRRFMTLLSFEFRQLDVTLALSVLDAGSAAFGSAAGAEGGDASASTGAGAAAAASLESRGTASPLTATELGVLFTPHDTKRLESYARNMVDYHMILDLLPDLARLYFQYRLPGVSLPRLQAGILMAMGCQRLTVEAVSEHFQVEVNQILAMFNKSVRKMSTALLS
ncbi:MAG: GNAT family N-acetyltransferase, partial [Methanobacteriota archaeon]